MAARKASDTPVTAAPTVRHALRRVYRTFHANLEQRLQQHGVSEAEYVVLFTLKRVPDISSADISRWTGVTPQGGNQVLRALLDRGLVERFQSPDHGRIMLARLTADGRRVIDACERDANELEDVMCGEMTHDEIEKLGYLLAKCASGLGTRLGMPGD